MHYTRFVLLSALELAQESTHIPLPRTSCTVQLYLQGSLGNIAVLFAQREETEVVGIWPVPNIG